MPKHVIIRRYTDWSIRVKLLTITILLIVGSVFLVSLLSYYKYTHDFQQQAAERTQQIIEQLSYNIEAYLDDVIRLSVTPCYNDTLMEALDNGRPATESAQLEKRRLIEGLLDNMMVQPRNDILSVYIIADEVYRGGRYPASNYNNADCNPYDWYKKALSSKDTIFVPAHMEEIIGNPRFKVFSIVKRIDSLKSVSKPAGVVKVDANYSGIESICNKVNMGRDGGLFIIDQNNTAIYSGTKIIPASDLLAMANSGKRPFFTIRIGKKDYLLNSAVIPSANWTILAVNSINELNSSAMQTRNINFLLALICSVFAILILLIFTRSFLRPLMTVIKLMKEVKRGNLNVEFPEQRKDEIGYLGASFNTMVLRINSMMGENTNLVKEVYEAKLLQREAQISALYSQIRPHFIYNTLNMISLLMQCGRNEKAIDNINKLSRLLRGITHLDKEIPLETEIGLLDSYLSIQSSRYDGRLEYSVEIDHSLYSYNIPALIFQPVVENSVVHGCEKRKEKTFIKIYSALENGLLIFYLEDNADGMDEAALESLRSKVYSLENGKEPCDGLEATTKGDGIGLVNVNRRIKIKFGGEYGLIIDSQKGVGTRVRIVLPIQALKEEEKHVQSSDSR